MIYLKQTLFAQKCNVVTVEKNKKKTDLSTIPKLVIKKVAAKHLMIQLDDSNPGDTNNLHIYLSPKTQTYRKQTLS